MEVPGISLLHLSQPKAQIRPLQMQPRLLQKESPAPRRLETSTSEANMDEKNRASMVRFQAFPEVPKRPEPGLPGRALAEVTG